MDLMILLNLILQNLIEGTKEFVTTKEKSNMEGICNIFERNYNNAFRFSVKRYYEKFLTESVCRECNGARLNVSARNVFVGNKSL